MFRGNKLCRLVLLLVLPPRKYFLIEQPDSEACPPEISKMESSVARVREF